VLGLICIDNAMPEIPSYEVREHYWKWMCVPARLSLMHVSKMKFFSLHLITF